MSTAAAVRKVLVVAGLGTGAGTGASVAQVRLFSKAGYSVALMARGADSVNALAHELNSGGAEAAPFPVEGYTFKDINSAWESIRAKYPTPQYRIDAAVFNVGHSDIWRPFLEVRPEDIRLSLELNVEAGFAFAKEAILTFKQNDISEPIGSRGTLILTGATASIRGNVKTSAFAAGKHGLRALAQSLAKEFGKDNIHVAHTIVDGVILSQFVADRRPDLVADENARLEPDSVAKAYLYLANQDRSAWTWELDLRPAHEKW